MRVYTSPEAMHALCSAFIHRAEPGDPFPSDAAACDEDGDIHSASSFAPVAVAFLEDLGVDSLQDLGRHWLLHRLHEILVERHRLAPGEAEVLRADMATRIATSGFSHEQQHLLAGAVERVLASIGPRSI